MARIIDPPWSELGQLPTPLNAGERAVIKMFDAKLPEEWEMYVQPHLNGLRPDLVLLHPAAGVAVFEVKDWRLGPKKYWLEQASPNHPPCLWARRPEGQRFVIRNPLDQIRLYKQELFDLYCPRLKSGAGYATITAGLIFTLSSRAEVLDLLGPLRAADEGMSKYPAYWPISGADDVHACNLDAIFPEWRRTASKYMSPAIAEDLRGWLREPASSRERRRPLELDDRQRELVTTRTESGFRRIKGPAGSGKSVVIAARAAELAAAGKQVLVATYNITILNYLRDLAFRHGPIAGEVRRQIEFVNFHLWCKRVCYACGAATAYHGLWRRGSDIATSSDEVLASRLAMLVQRLYDDPRRAEDPPRYDAIFVDEGQDFRPLWWQTLQRALRPGGEMLLAADKTQDVYSTASAWTEDTMSESGFRGQWATLGISYRLPPAVVPLAERFATEFLATAEVDLPRTEHRPEQMEFADLFPVTLRWIQIRDASTAVEACIEELKRQMTHLRPDAAASDLTILCGRQTGFSLKEALRRDRINVLNTFDHESAEEQRKKRAFFQGHAAVKSTTLHSFKGWEARHLVLLIDRFSSSEDRAIIYTALTRLRRHEHGSSMSVVCSCDSLRAYGRQWPTFLER